MKALAASVVKKMARLSTLRSAERSLANAKDNFPHIERSLLDPEVLRAAEGRGSAIVVCAGPSIHIQNPAAAIVASGYRGVTIAVDGALGYCLRNGLVPDYVMILDPHPTRVARWLGDPDLEKRDDDDYFRRQEMDPYLGVNERAKNRELIELVDRHGPRIKAIASTSIALAVTRRCLSARMPLYWWNPLLDDFEKPGSMTRALYAQNRMPCMVSGGNVGSAAWVFAHQILGFDTVALVGMDFGYAPGTPIQNTQYYKEIAELFGDKAADAFIDVYNPHLKTTWFTDPAYFWYRQSFLKLARAATCRTVNCTEGGTLFGKGVEFTRLATFLEPSAAKPRRK